MLAYARVSTENQSERGTSLDGQRAEFAEFCRREHLPSPIVRVEVESAGASAEERRLELRRILAEAGPGDLVLVSRLDRWSRHAAFALATIEDIEARGAAFRSIAEPGNMRDDALSLGLRALIAQDEHRRIRERTVERRRALRLGGAYVEGTAPIGYLIEGRRLVPDPATAPVVVEAFALCTAGHSLRRIAARLQARHGVGLGSSAVAYLLRNRAYLGEMQTAAWREMVAGRPRGPRGGSGEWVPAHEAIVDRLTFARAAKALESRRKRGGRPALATSPTAHWLARGFVRCAACGASCEAKAYRAGHGGTSQPGHDGWYGCRRRLAPHPGEKRCTRGPLVRRLAVDEALAALVVERLAALAALWRAPASPARVTEAIDFTARRRAIAAKRARIVEAYAEGVLTRTDLARQTASLDRQAREVDAAEAEDVEARGTARDTPGLRRAARARVLDVRRVWASRPGDAAGRRAIVAALVERVLLGADGAVRVEWRDAGAMLGAMGGGGAP